MTFLRTAIVTFALTLAFAGGEARAQFGAAGPIAAAPDASVAALPAAGPEDGGAAAATATSGAEDGDAVADVDVPDAAAEAAATTAPSQATPAPAAPAAHAGTAQSSTATARRPNYYQELRQMVTDPTLGAGLRAVLGLFIFLAGWLVARAISRGVLSLSRRLLADPRVVETLGFGSLALAGDGPPEEGEAAAPPRRIEEIVSLSVYYLLLFLVAIAVLEIAGAAESSGRLRHILDVTMHTLPLVARALVTLLIAFVLGRVLQKGTVRFLQSIQIDRRFGGGAAASTLPAPEASSPDRKISPVEPRLSERVGLATFWLIMLFGLLSALEALQIGQLSGPLRRALERVTDFLPALGAAALLLLGGYLLGRIGRVVVRNLLEAAGFNRLMARLQLDKPFKKTTPAKAMGALAMLFIMVQAAIAALNQLELRTLSNPLAAMMTKFYAALPALGLSVIVIGVGVVAGRLVRGWVEAVLKNVGFDRLMDRIGLGKLRGNGDGLAVPSAFLAFIAQIGVILVATAQALQALHLTTWSGYIDAVLAFAVERLGVALIIVVIGFGVGTYVRGAILARKQEDNAESITWIAGAARWAVLVFAFTVAIHQLGVAEHFVRTAFILLFGSLCLALALALGLGGREVAGEIVRRQFERKRATPPDEGGDRDA